MFERIIVPLDGTEWSKRALEAGEAIAEKFGARLTLLHAYKGEERSLRDVAIMQSGADAAAVVNPSLYDAVLNAAKAEEANAQRYLQGLAGPLRQRGMNVETLLMDAPASNALLQQVNREAGTLVVMCSHGRTGLDKLFSGNIAEDLLRESYVPVLVMRLPEDTHTGGASGSSDSTIDSAGRQMMATDVRIGGEVMGTTGKLGEVHRVIVDARTGNITDMVVKHGFIFGNERIVPLSHITRVEDGVIYVDLDEKHFEIMDGYADDRFRAPDPDYSGPPGFNNEEFMLDELVAAGGAGGSATGAPPLGYPGGEQVTPDDMQRPVMRTGTPIIDMNGEKVGEVGDVSVSAPDGRPTRMTLRRGHIFHHEVELPLEWIDELSDKGVTLKVDKSQVESLTAEEKR